MSILETVLIYVGIPVLVFAILAGLTFALSKGPIAGKHPAHYQLGERWTHAPVLWSAVDEVTTSGHHGGHAALTSGAELIGGRANGRW